MTVLIVGAGPSGLALAVVLSKAGVPALVVDPKPAAVDESRASILHIRTLELLDKWELARPAIAAGVTVRAAVLRTGERELARFPLDRADPTPFPFALLLPQSITERHLAGVLAPGSVRFGTELVGYRQDDREVVAVVRDSDGELSTINARYLVGADGAHSLVRRIAGVPVTGGSYPPTGFLADVRLDPPSRRDTIDLNLADGGIVGILDLGAGWTRLFGALTPAYARRFSLLAEGRAVPASDLQQWFDEYFRLPLTVREVGWSSIYRIRHRLAESFHQGRTFLVGDAAHVHSPAGGQGMNLGIGDAINLGWKLALVHHGQARAALLDTYGAERWPVARKVLRGADRGFELEATPNRAVDWFRRQLLPALVTVAARVPSVRRISYNLFAQTWIGYRGSPAVSAGRRSGLQPGDRVPEANLATGRSLHDLLRAPDHHVLVCEGDQPGDHEPAVRDLLAGYPLTVHTHLIRAPDQGLRTLFGTDAALVALVRPDGHLATIGPADDLTPLREHLDRWYTAA